jgi:putative FmdB family regulatory protein
MSKPVSNPQALLTAGGPYFIIVPLGINAGKPLTAADERREAMPTYEFLCRDCRKSFTLSLSLAEHEKGKYQCPKCKSRHVEQQISTFQTKTSRKS